MVSMQKDLISIHDLTSSDIEKILSFAQKLKKKPLQNLLKGKSLAMIFEKPSTRTRVSFEVGMFELGGKTVHLSPNAVQLGIRESITDVARTLSRYVDGVMLRTFSHNDLVEFAKASTVPVINGLSDLLHPCQAFGDIFTIGEKRGKEGLRGVKMAYIGDGNNVCHSLMMVAAKVGINMVIATPHGYEPKERILNLATEDAKKSYAKIELTRDPILAARDADVIYTDVWASMGQEEEAATRKREFSGFQVNRQILSFARPNVLVMHCLPAHRDEEITNEVIEGPHSVVFDQAENRLHVQKAILALLLGGK